MAAQLFVEEGRWFNCDYIKAVFTIPLITTNTIISEGNTSPSFMVKGPGQLHVHSIQFTIPFGNKPEVKGRVWV